MNKVTLNLILLRTVTDGKNQNIPFDFTKHNIYKHCQHVNDERLLLKVVKVVNG